MGTTVHGAIGFDAMADNAAATVVARRGQGLDGALEAIEGMGVTGLGDLKALSYSLPQVSQRAMLISSYLSPASDSLRRPCNSQKLV
jgi:hypothetical protein